MLEKSAAIVFAVVVIPFWAEGGPKKDVPQKKAQQQLLARQAATKSAENQRNAARKLSQKTAAAHQAAVNVKNNAEARDALKQQAQKQQVQRSATFLEQPALLSRELQDDSD